MTATATRRARVLDAMRGKEIDALLLGREANARYVSGADRLWLAGTRPFAPGCVLVGATGDVHLLSVTDDGVPADVPPEHLFPISWNPMTILGNVTAIPEVATARRVGVDGLSPLFEMLLGATLPDAVLVDAEALLRAVRRIKADDDVGAIRAAIGAAEAALGATDGALEPGLREVDVKAAYEEAMTAADLTAPAFEARFTVADAGTPPRAFASERAIGAGDRVHVRAGVMFEGWEGLVTRTLVCAGTPVRTASLRDAVAACASGARVGDLRDRWFALEGTGMGHEELADDDRLEPGMVVHVEVLDDGVLDGATVLVGAGGAEALSDVG